MSSAITQRNIVNFLEGQFIQKSEQIHTFDLRARVELGGSTFSRSFSLNSKALEKSIKEDFLKQLENNCMPETCLKCSMASFEGESQYNPSVNAITVRQKAVCKMGGCNKGKLEFASKLKDSKNRMIELEVLEDKGMILDQDEYFANNRIDEYPANNRVNRSRIHLNAYNKGDTLYLARLRDQQIKNEAQKAEAKLLFEHAELKKAQREAELAEIKANEKSKRELDELMEIQESNHFSSSYEVEVW